MELIIIGVDPGYTGGICILSGETATVFNLPVMKVKDKNKNKYDVMKLIEILSKYKKENPIVAIENVHTMPNQGVSSSGALMEGKGILIGVASALFGSLPKMISPASWKKAFPQLTETDDLNRRRDELKSLKDNLKSATKTEAKSIKKEIAKLHGQFKSIVKTRTRMLASETFPNISQEFKLVKDDGKADAAFIALYMRQKSPS